MKRIHRSRFSRHITRHRLFSFGGALVLVAVLGVAAFYRPPSALAITPPDSCFGFDSDTGTITNYYDN